MAGKKPSRRRASKAKSASTFNTFKNVSFWSETAKPASAHPLQHKIDADVCIVGAGIAGITTAYLLAREGKSVVVLDKREIGRGETANTSAHLSNVLDASYRDIEKFHGSKGAQLAAASHSAAISQIESIVAAESIDCEFARVDGYLALAKDHSEKGLDEEFKAASQAGVIVEKLSRPPAGLGFGKCLRFPGQAQFHPLNYLAGLARAAQRAGVKFFSQTEAKEIKGGKTASVKTKHRTTVTAKAVVVATNTPVNDWVTMHTKQAAYRTYIIGATVAADSIPRALFWDTEDPFHYVRLQCIKGQARDLLIIGGEDHKTGQDEGVDDRYIRLADWARAHFPGIEDIAYQWSGQILESVDGLAYLGGNPDDEPNVFIITGDSGSGLTHGTIGAMLLRDLILERENPWTNLYDPSRKPVRSALEFARENLNVMAEYGQWVTPGEVDSPEAIAPGTGAIVRRGLSKIAVYRSPAGELVERSAVCPHLGCIVAWNATENSWDCPCHGSRFATSGAVLNGPALGPLEKIPAQFSGSASRSASQPDSRRTSQRHMVAGKR
jgi:glycine/D-amino acid oxidase-like deaminating enzyme/nitrite reductase/ring-hydroxylating ferredoxin subunit